jgi:hypothetical protein
VWKYYRENEMTKARMVRLGRKEEDYNKKKDTLFAFLIGFFGIVSVGFAVWVFSNFISSL